MAKPASATSMVISAARRVLSSTPASLSALLARVQPTEQETPITMPTIPPPQVLSQPPNIPEKQLFGPGPSNMTADILASLGSPLLGHLHTEFTKIMDDCRVGLQYLFQTENPLTFAVSGTGHAGIECAVFNLLEAGDTLLVVQNGIWGTRTAALGRRLGLNVQTIVIPEGGVATLQQIEQALAQHRPKLLYVCHGESSTGVAHPLQGIGELVHRYNGLFMVDTVASIGGAPFNADELGVDCVCSATQKVLNAPPGLAPISFSPRAVEAIEARRTPVISFYFDALELGNYWGCFGEARRYHHTGMVSLVYALRASLAGIAAEGIENVVARHKANAAIFYDELAKVGLEPFVEDPSIRLPCLTTVKVPAGVDWKAVADILMAQRIEISGGLGPTVGKIWRIGTFGTNSDPKKIAGVVAALKAAIDKVQASKI